MIFQAIQAVLWTVALTALIATAWTDLKDRIIPNELAAVVAMSGLCISLMLRPEQVWISLIVAVLVVIGLGVLAHFGMMGGGDVKLIGATTLLVPLDQIGQLMAFIAVAGGLLSCVYLFLRRFVRTDSLAKSPSHAEAVAAMDGESRGLFSNECARIAAGGPMPYAFAIVGGVAGTFAGEIPRCLSANFCFFLASLS
jgi:prepilin peptidase CpaA